MLLTWLLRDHIQLLLPEEGDKSLIVAIFEPTDEVFGQTIQDSEVLANRSLRYTETLSDLLVANDVVAIEKGLVLPRDVDNVFESPAFYPR